MTEERFGRLTDVPATLRIVGARLVDPSAGVDEVRDVTVRDGVIANDGGVDGGAGEIEAVDGTGLILAPGLCDLHAHLREPGGESAETIASGTRAAARGGFTTVCAMPNTDPPLDDAARVEAVVCGAAGDAARVRVIGAVTRGWLGEELADLEAMAAAGVVGVSDDGAAVPTNELVRDALGTLGPLGVPLIEHAEDAALAGDGVMREGLTALRLGLLGWPVEAELAIVRRDLALAEASGARLHLTHLSSAASVDEVRRAKGRGVAVTCDVTPHHLALTDEWVAGSRRFSWEEADERLVHEELAYDGACRVNPPLASRDDTRALLAGLADGTVDAIATDHAPHPPERKLVPFGQAAPGMIGLETALSLGLGAVEAGVLSLPTLVAALSTRPAAIIGEGRALAVGQPADLVLFDPTARRRVEASALASRSSNTPLLGIELPGVVRLTIAAGRVTYRS